MTGDPEWPLLAALSPRRRHTFVESCGRPRQFAAGQRLVHLGAPARGLFLVRSGHLAAIVPGEVGEEQIVNILGAGDCFGELGLIDGAERSASIQALDDCDVYFMSKADFERCRRESPELDQSLLRYLVKRVRELTIRVADGNRSAGYRVVRQLLDTAAAFGVRRRDGIVPISHATLATMTGVAESTVQSELKQLRKAGLIDQERRQIRLLDIDGLADIVGDHGQGEIG